MEFKLLIIHFLNVNAQKENYFAAFLNNINKNLSVGLKDNSQNDKKNDYCFLRE